MSKSKSVYVRLFYDLKLLRYVLSCVIERQLQLPAGMNTVYCYYIFLLNDINLFFNVVHDIHLVFNDKFSFK